MKKIQIKSTIVPTGPGRELGIATGAVAADGTTDTTRWLSGPNPWGWHQDARFSSPLSAVRQGLRIIEAAEKASQSGAPTIDLRDEDYKVLVEIVNEPHQHAQTIGTPASLIRSLVVGGIVDAVLDAQEA